MTSRDQRMLDLLLQWPACGTWGYEETLESEDDKLQALFWQLHVRNQYRVTTLRS
jgi:hypothetical protein